MVEKKKIVNNFSPYQGELEGVVRRSIEGFAKRPLPTSPDRRGERNLYEKRRETI